jgi:hypothetical protein
MNKKIARRSARGLPAQAPTYLLLERGYKKERFDPTCQSGERRRGSSNEVKCQSPNRRRGVPLYWRAFQGGFGTGVFDFYEYKSGKESI